MLIVHSTFTVDFCQCYTPSGVVLTRMFDHDIAQVAGLEEIEPSQLIRSRKRSSSPNDTREVSSSTKMKDQAANWRRILLLIVAITVHNIPGTSSN